MSMDTKRIMEDRFSWKAQAFGVFLMIVGILIIVTWWIWLIRVWLVMSGTYDQWPELRNVDIKKRLEAFDD